MNQRTINYIALGAGVSVASFLLVRARARATFRSTLEMDPSVQAAIRDEIVVWDPQTKAAELIPLIGLRGPKKAMAEVLAELASKGAVAMAVDEETGEVVPTEELAKREAEKEEEKGLAATIFSYTPIGLAYYWATGT